MPLDGNHPPLGSLDRLDQAVSRPGDGNQAFAQAIDALMVPGSSLHCGLAAGLVQSARLRHLHLVHQCSAALGRSVFVHPGDVGEMLMERAAERHVHHLQASTDGEDRNVRAVRFEEQVDLQVVAFGLDPVHGWVLRLAEPADPHRLHR